MATSSQTTALLTSPTPRVTDAKTMPNVSLTPKSRIHTS
jgi:hypothetical protein